MNKKPKALPPHVTGASEHCREAVKEAHHRLETCRDEILGEIHNLANECANVSALAIHRELETVKMEKLAEFVSNCDPTPGTDAVAAELEKYGRDPIAKSLERINKLYSELSSVVSDAIEENTSPPLNAGEVMAEMKPGDLAEAIASMMQTWHSVELEEFKRHLGHALYPFQH